MKLTELLKNVPVEAVIGKSDIEIDEINFDSRKVGKRDLFVAVKGTQVDGHKFIDKAIAQGATAVMCEILPETLPEGITFLQVENARRELARIAGNYYGNPARKITMIGITGTNGKTTSATLLYQLFNALGHTSGLVSTIEYRIGKEVYPSTHTTPDPLQLHKLFAEMYEAGCEYCFMEVSSHALVQHRVTGIPFHLATFTNITHDHLNYHGSFAEYIRAKKLLFDHLSSKATAIVNGDDKNGQVMVQNTPAKVLKFGLRRMADYRSKVLENTYEGLLMEIEGEEVWFRMIGSFNAYNLLMVYAVAVELGMDKALVLQELSGIEGVAGRFQVIRSQAGLSAIVDYAHTPDALKNVLGTIHDINQGRGQIITVVGCGGDRDKTKRPKMASIASEQSDKVIFTSDNPRSEDPQEILDQMKEGVPRSLRKKILMIENRREAIRTACALAQPGDIILVAGKGHETYQEINGKRFPFDDREVLTETMANDNA